MANIDCFETWLEYIKRSFLGLFGAIKTIEIVEELVEIGLDKVCDTTSKCPNQQIQPLWVNKYLSWLYKPRKNS